MPGPASFDGSSIHYFMRPLGHYDLPTLPLFDDQQVYPLAPCSSPFPLATISLAIHFGYLISFMLSNCRPILSLLRPFPTFLWHHAAIHLIVSTIPTPTPTQEVTVNSPPYHFEEQSQKSIRRLHGSPIIQSSHSFDTSPTVSLIDRSVYSRRNRQTSTAKDQIP